MIISANTKIASILKQHPGALEAIISISPRFAKLRNPILRNLMAGRTTLAMAAKAGGCTVTNFYDQLKPLGFDIDLDTKPVEVKTKVVPDFMITLDKAEIVSLDVRPVISSGDDPLHLILENIKALKTGQVLKIINSFKPVPLIILLEKKGFTSYTDNVNDDVVETYFHKDSASLPIESVIHGNASEGWVELMHQFNGRIKTIDVRSLEMPLPMTTILDSLESLPAETALFVHHKRIPFFLLPELTERKFDYRVKEICDGEVDLLIFRN